MDLLGFPASLQKLSHAILGLDLLGFAGPCQGFLEISGNHALGTSTVATKLGHPPKPAKAKASNQG